MLNVKELPTGYHVQNFLTLLDTVYQQYSDLLTVSELHLYQSIRHCSYDAQSLYVRMLTRKGPVFRIDKLKYADIGNAQQAIAELVEKGLATWNSAHSAEALFSLFTKAELLNLFAAEASACPISQLRKSELMSILLENQCADSFCQRIQTQFPYIEPNYLAEFETFRSCFFANSHQDLSEFVITDLGHLQYESYALDQAARYFTNRKQIENQIAYSQLSQILEDKSVSQDPASLFALASELPPPSTGHDLHPALNRRYQKLLNTIARQLERLQQPELALLLYRQSNLHPSRERQTRLLKQQSSFTASWELCRQLVDSSHPEEREFAERFLPALAKRLGKPHSTPAPQPIQQSRLSLHKSEYCVEQNVAMALSDQEHSCCYVENAVFCSLFGLLFWDIIFTPVSGAFINPFQRGPLDLFSEHFYADRKALLDARLRQLESEQWQSTIRHFYATKQGITNHFVYWGALDPELLEKCFNHLPARDLQHIFQRMLEHPGLYSSGFPDLIRFFDAADSAFTLEQPRYQLIEVKAPGDKLQANQKRWLAYFSRHRIPAQVVWVDWIDNETDPE